MKIETAWEVAPEESSGERADRETRISDFALFACLPLAGLAVPGLGLPVNEIAALAVVGLCAFRTPRAGPRPPWWFAGLLVAMLLFMAVSAQLNGIDASRRLVHLVGYVGIAVCLASGRVSMLSAARGLAIALAGAVAYGAAVLPTSTYTGRLTGAFDDPNVGALLLTTLGAVSVPHVQKTWLRRLLLLAVAAGVLLTFSRTGLLALAFGLLWLLLGRRLRLAGGGLLVVALVWVVDNIPQDLRLLGPFSDRTGSDALRGRIIDQETSLLASAPWYGNGPGTARVSVGNQQFFFHNSYLAVRQEGGWVTLGIVVVLLGACFVYLSRADAGAGITERTWMQTGIIAVLAMGVSLGEVLLDLPTAVVLGFAMSSALSAARSAVIRPAALPAAAGVS
ncbi:MAG: O-antigen ligase family protein [Nocardioides sp.]